MTSPMTRRGILALIVFLCLSATGVVSVSATAADHADRSESLSSKAAAKAATNKITYRGRGVEIARLSGNQRQLKGAPRAFKKYVVKRLDEMFTEAGSAKRCATAPTIVIKRFDARGFATANRRTWATAARWRGRDSLLVLGASVPVLAAILTRVLPSG